MFVNDMDDGNGLDTLRLWISDQQWITILEHIEQTSMDYEGLERRESGSDRHNRSFRCLLRLEASGDKPGIYLVRTRNISDGGIGFLHGLPIPTHTRCTVAMQADNGQGMIVSGRVAWCRQISLEDDTQPPAYEIGIQFDRVIDAAPFLDGPAF